MCSYWQTPMNCGIHAGLTCLSTGIACGWLHVWPRAGLAAATMLCTKRFLEQLSCFLQRSRFGLLAQKPTGKFTGHPQDYGTCLQEMHVDGFRFDLGSIMTRAHSQWHRASATDNGKPAGLLSGGKVPGVQGELPSQFSTKAIVRTPLQALAVGPVLSCHEGAEGKL